MNANKLERILKSLGHTPKLITHEESDTGVWYSVYYKYHDELPLRETRVGALIDYMKKFNLNIDVISYY